MISFFKAYAARPRILFAATFCWLTVIGGRFLAPFLEHEAGLKPADIGFVIACQQVVLTFASSLAGKWADRMEQRMTDRDVNAAGKGRLLVVLTGTFLGTLAFSLHGLYRLVPTFQIFQTVFWHAMVQCLQGFGASCVFPVLDGLTVDFLPNRQDYGKERLHGPLWWAVSNLLLSPLLDRYGFAICYPLSFMGTGLVGVSTWLFASRPSQATPIPLEESVDIQMEEFAEDLGTTAVDSPVNTHDSLLPFEQEEETTIQNFPLFRLAALLLSTFYGLAFLLCLFCISSGQAIVDNLIFLFFEGLGSHWWTMGITVVIKIAAEVPVFYFGPQLLQQLGAAPVLLMGCASYLIRVLLYPWIPKGNVVFILLLEPLHGITYGASQLSMVDFVASQMPAGNEASGQGLVYLFKDGGSVLGVLLGGWADGTVGPDLMFALSAGIVTVGIVALSSWLVAFGRGVAATPS